VAEQTANQIKQQPDQTIAIISREHKDLAALLPYLHRAGITGINYERQHNALDSQPVQALIILARIVTYISKGAHSQANELLPELLAHNALNIPAKHIWQLSLSVQHRHNWLETMQNRPEFSVLADWLIEQAKAIQNHTLETAIDDLFNKYFKPFYFSDAKLAADPDTYLDYLSDLIALRDAARDYAVNDNPTLLTFVEMLDLYRKYDLIIPATRLFGQSAKVHLMTAHKAKGLEFDTVFVVHASKDRWLKEKSDSFFPSNLHVSLPGSLDENLRLIFVSITRAKNQLFISAPKRVSAKQANLTILPHLGDIARREVETKSTAAVKLETAWQDKYSAVNQDLKAALAPRLADYQLNATALNSFTNLEYAGPQQFLLNNLLRFPSAKSAHADYGTAVHETLKYAHNYFNQHRKKPTSDDLAATFTDQLTKLHLAPADFAYYHGRGLEHVLKYVETAEFTPQQQVEQVLTARLGDVQLTGKLDLIEVDDKARTINVFDYKTGDVFDKFNQGPIKSHNYYQQLLFYKLLIEHATNRPGYKISRGVLHFIEAKDGERRALELDFTQADFDKFEQLVKTVWHKIQKLDFPNTTAYAKNLRGTLQFEADLLAGKI
jgi:DNA helicase-2/ATP-dependent DNA helicase PcrA